jgi:heavy metal sensor kinase
LFGEGPGGFYYVTWYRDNTVLSRSPSAPAGVPPPPALQHDTLTHLRTRDGRREAFHCSGLGDCVLAGRSTAGDVAAMRTLALSLLGIGAGVLALALGVGRWLIGRAILPIEQIGAAAGRISQGNLSERIPVPDNGAELGRLAAVLNSTFARLEAAFERQRQFTADAAHELRTPLAVMISETQTALARPRCADEYRETVEGCLDTSQQMRRLTESLLTLSRFDGGNDPEPRTQVDLRQAVRTVIERLSPLARAKGIAIRADLSAASVLSSPDRMSQVITNLLTNAIDYNRPGGEVAVSTATASGSALLIVADTGVGIAEADLPFIFDRFYRVDRSRSRAEGHTGLGLAICKAIVEAEGGAIEAESKLNAGTTFTIRFPLKAT